MWFVLSKSDTAFYSLAAVAVHEAGHIAAGIVTGKRISSVTLSPLGADIQYYGISSYKADLMTAAAGPLFSIFSGFLAFRIFYNFTLISAAYGLLNLIPVPCFDGGRIIRCALYSFTDTLKADRICDVLSLLFLIVMYIFSVFLLFYTSFNASLLFISAYVFFESYIKMK